MPAAEALLAVRSGCLARHDAACLSRADERGSPLYTDDVKRLARSAKPSPLDAPDYAGYRVTMIERIGGSAVVALAPPNDAENAEPATALLVEGEAGWRLRQLYRN